MIGVRKSIALHMMSHKDAHSCPDKSAEQS